MQDTVKGERRQGGQKKRWEDSIREWTGLEFAKSKKAMENREKWRKLVVKLSLVPHRPSPLRDRFLLLLHPTSYFISVTDRSILGMKKIKTSEA